ncbi:MAG TPA: outer membrane lipoprotein LolB [Gammaproteobacteria bacterium]|nr:outer membrane lipoprotein LolB [Gammaproteobacteria bacterium]
MRRRGADFLTGLTWAQAGRSGAVLVELSAVVFVLILTALLAGGCASTPEKKTPPPVATGKPRPPARESREDPPVLRMADQRQSRFARLKQWKIEGRLGVRHKDDGFSAEMKWLQDGNHFDIRLIDPLGRQVARLTGDEGRVELRTMDGKSFKARRAENLLEAALGWSFPVQSLLYWVKGVPDPNFLVWRQEYDDLGRLERLEQNKWRLTISRYQGLGSEYIPRIIRMARGDLKVKLLIRDWE